MEGPWLSLLHALHRVLYGDHCTLMVSMRRAQLHTAALLLIAAPSPLRCLVLMGQLDCGVLA